MEKKHYTLLTAALGVLLGVLISVITYKITSSGKAFDGDYNRWRKLNLILQEVERNYVDTIDMKSMTDAAVVAALAELDPHSVYLPPVDREESDTELSGGFEGIGITFNVPNDTAIVLNTIAGGPSEKAGLLAGDRILKVSGRNIAGVKFPQDSMIRLMKGPAGTKVNILIGRDRSEIPFEIVRDKIPVHCIDAAYMLNDTTGYMKLAKFTRTTYMEFLQASAKLLDQGMTRLIFDLRDNNGGYFDQAYRLANEFLDKGDLIVYMEGRNRPKNVFKADGSGHLRNVKLSVLVNEGSASSSEIFAGAIQDNDRGRIVGRRSFGKGLVQEPVNFTDGSGIRLTVARFYTPSGRCIQKPYSDDYAYDVYERYRHGEMVNADSMKVDRTEQFFTKGGRIVYGGGGIIPDVFVPMDTSKVTKFYMECNKKTVTMRFAAAMFDRYKSSLSLIDDYSKLERYIDSLGLESLFLDYASKQAGVVPAEGEWEESKPYMMPQIRGLVARYSKVGEEAYYRMYIGIDDALQVALREPSTVQFGF